MVQLVRSPGATRVGTIWLVNCQPQFFDPRGDLVRALASVRRPGPTQRWGYLTVQPFYRR
jgi:hypothetical protein